MNYGGGLVAGDHVAIDCDVGAGCTVAMTTQVSVSVGVDGGCWWDGKCVAIQSPSSLAVTCRGHQGSTKIYKTPPPGVDRAGRQLQQQHGQGRTVQSFRAMVAAGATLALLPDPYTCFRCVVSQDLLLCCGSTAYPRFPIILILAICVCGSGVRTTGSCRRWRWSGAGTSCWSTGSPAGGK